MKPIIVIGAPRSGTNILRDTLTRLPPLVTWPCDEINLIWRHGNLHYPSDEFPPDLATAEVRRYLRGQFERLSSRSGNKRVVEKTCANSLRVDFVDRVFPRASYVFIVRDPIDAVASAMRRWRAPFDFGYTLRKLRYVPISDVPYYARRFVANRWHRLSSGDNRLRTWGPVFAGMSEIAASASLEELCALQWCHCVRRAEDSLGAISPQRVVRIEYEDLATRPLDTLEEICDFLAIDLPPDTLAAAATGVHTDSIGKGRTQMTAEQLALVTRTVTEF